MSKSLRPVHAGKCDVRVADRREGKGVQSLPRVAHTVYGRWQRDRSKEMEMDGGQSVSRVEGGSIVSAGKRSLRSGDRE